MFTCCGVKLNSFFSLNYTKVTSLRPNESTRKDMQVTPQKPYLTNMTTYKRTQSPLIRDFHAPCCRLQCFCLLTAFFSCITFIKNAVMQRISVNKEPHRRQPVIFCLSGTRPNLIRFALHLACACPLLFKWLKMGTEFLAH